MSLDGKVAIVTGGNTGIGKAVVLALAAEGAKVVIDYVFNPEATEELHKEIAALGEQSVGVEADVSKIEDLQRLVDTAVSTYGRLDILVNNAGIETRTSTLETTEAQYDKVMDINLKSAFFGTQIAAKQMIAQGGGGRIINMTSVHEDWPMPGNSPYCLSKGGMRMLTRNAGQELGPHGICVTGVGPGAVATPINTATMNDPAAMARLDTAIPLGRMAQPEEIASVVVFCRATARATSTPRRSSPTAASCTAAPASDRTSSPTTAGRSGCPSTTTSLSSAPAPAVARWRTASPRRGRRS